jgi:hypothetical protein
MLHRIVYPDSIIYVDTKDPLDVFTSKIYQNYTGQYGNERYFATPTSLSIYLRNGINIKGDSINEIFIQYYYIGGKNHHGLLAVGDIFHVQYNKPIYIDIDKLRISH